MTHQWKRLHKKTIAQQEFYSVRRDTLLNPRNKKEIEVTIFETSDAVNVIALTKDQKVVLVKQYRFGTGTIITECPGGFVDAGEDQQTAAKRELLEETGYRGRTWTYLGSVPNNPAFMTAYIHHWLVKDAEKVEQQQLDEGEDVEVVEIPLENVKQMLLNGEIDHPHAISAFMRWKELWT